MVIPYVKQAHVIYSRKLASTHNVNKKIQVKRIGYDLNVMQLSAYLVINPITVNNIAALCGSGVRLYDGLHLKLFSLVGWDRSFRLLLGPPGLN